MKFFYAQVAEVVPIRWSVL